MPHNQILVQVSTPKRGPKKSEEDEDGMCEEGWATDLDGEGGARQIPLPKHLGQVTGCLWDGSSKWGFICCHHIWADSM